VTGPPSASSSGSGPAPLADGTCSPLDVRKGLAASADGYQVLSGGFARLAACRRYPWLSRSVDGG
jgi:hypothetical protein